MKIDKDYYTTGEVAIVLGVVRETVVKYIKSGDIIASKTFGGHYRISADELKRLKRNLKRRN